MMRPSKRLPSAGAVLDSLECRVLLSVAHHSYSGVRYHPVRTATPGVIIAKGVARRAPSVRGVKANGGATPAGSIGPVGKVPSQISHVYGFDNVSFPTGSGSVLGDGAGQTIAIIDAYYTPTIANDLAQFSSQFGLPAANFQAVDQRGNAITTTNHPVADRTKSWELEAALDVEWVHAMAPGASIILVECDTSNWGDLIVAGAAWASSQPGVSVVSMSFGGSEFPNEVNYHDYLSTPAGHQGVTFVASTGDTGTPAQFPSTSGGVVAVGGTNLQLNGNEYGSESAWSSGGGGLSAYESQPTFQNGVVTQSSTMRAAPDVSFVGDPNTGVAVYDSYGSSTAPWVQVGGTSLSAPIFSGLVAVANQGRVLNSLGTLDGAADTLPKLYAAPAADFHDITTGSNGLPAGPGYDLATGLGSPYADRLIPYLAQTAAAGTVAVSGATNAVTVKRDADGVHGDVSVNGVQVQQYLVGQSGALTITGAGGDESVTFDFSMGNPLPGLGAVLNAGAGANVISIIGTSGNDAVVAGISTVSVSGGAASLSGGAFSNVTITASGVQAVNFAGGSGGADTLTFTGTTRQTTADTPSGAPNVSVSVLAGATVSFIGDQHLAGLAVDNASASLAATAAMTVAGVLTLSNGGTLNVNAGQLLVSTTANAGGTVTGYLAGGYNGGLWTGTGGIVSAAAAANHSLYTLGYATNGDAVAVVIPAGFMLVKFTVIGDADLSGTTNFNDFLTQQNNYTKAGNWSRGDFDYSGIVNFNDYLILQNGYGKSV